jgi:hypothetical protein
VLEYNTPVDFTGYTARMQIREKVTSEVVLHELTTENGGIVFDNTTKTITLNIPADTTAQFKFTQAVYGLEFAYFNQQVIPFASGNISLYKEVTR